MRAGKGLCCRRGFGVRCNLHHPWVDSAPTHQSDKLGKGFLNPLLVWFRVSIHWGVVGSRRYLGRVLVLGR